jgi:hypothetical protein
LGETYSKNKKFFGKKQYYKIQCRKEIMSHSMMTLDGFEKAKYYSGDYRVLSVTRNVTKMKLWGKLRITQLIRQAHNVAF